MVLVVLTKPFITFRRKNPLASFLPSEKGVAKKLTHPGFTALERGLSARNLLDDYNIFDTLKTGFIWAQNYLGYSHTNLATTLDPYNF